MWKKRYSYALLLISLICVFVSGCSSKSQNPTWKPVWEVPPYMLEYQKGGEFEYNGRKIKTLDRLMHRSFQGVIPQAFRDENGNYRICWIKKDPMRDSYWYELYEFSADGLMKEEKSSIPSSLKGPDPQKIPGW